MLPDLTPRSSIGISRIKTGLMIEIDSPGGDQFPAIFGISFNIGPDIEAWNCLLEWLNLNEADLEYLGSSVLRITNLSSSELTYLVASAWMIEDIVETEGADKEYILSLMNKFLLIKT